jgi:hypothetical protein
MSDYEDGARGEFVVAEMLKSDGWYIANASNLDEIAGDDSAPMVRGEDGNKITPDILAIRQGRTAWVEVKLKRTGAEWINKNQQYEHFIDEKNWDSYHQISSSSGCEVWLAIIELPEQTLRRQLIDEIRVVGRWDETQVKKYNGEKYGEPGVFVPQSDFYGIDIPGDLAREICEQRQLSGTADIDAEVLPETFDAGDDGQSGLGDFIADGGER